MNCPGHILIYQTKLRSYKDLPIRFFEFGTVYRYEKSGVLHGLLRVRGFTQDDAHIFCTPDQLEEEIIKVIEFVFFMMKTFGFDYEIYLSTRPEKFVGTTENWEKATSALEHALIHHQEKFQIDPGQGVFYGPKIDVKLKDALGRLWQGPTIQVDFNLPQRFDLKYIGADGSAHQPVMIHRVVLGSMERFIGALIEHYAGAFPFWLAPLQIIILPITQRNTNYANNVLNSLRNENFRVEIDDRNEKMNLKIREAQLQKIPYMIIVGDKEEKQNLISIRHRKDCDLGQKQLPDFINTLKKENNLNVL
jgi:threonyl-tRNA synthetase